jgi:hypothetical protein
MTGQLEGKRVAILATDGVERVELEQPAMPCHRHGPTLTSRPSVPRSCRRSRRSQPSEPPEGA